jgi:hypothetical protein
MNSDTPLPPDVAAGENPPDGAMIDYYIGINTSASVTLEIKDEGGLTVRRYSSADPLPTPDPALAIPPYWVRPPQKLASEPGLHRFLWDMHHAPIPGLQPQYPIAAVYRNTPPAATSPWALPGNYTVVLTVGGKSYRQALKLVMDPRVKTSQAALAEQFKLSKQVYDEWLALNSISESVRLLRGRLADLRPRVPDGDLKTHIDALAAKLQALLGAGGGPVGPTAPPPRLTVSATTGRLRTLFDLMEEVDLAPTPQAAAAVPEVLKDSRSLKDDWEAIRLQELTSLNQALRAAGLPVIELAL